MTLHRYVQEGKIRITKLPNGYYEYNDEDVYKFINKDIRRQNSYFEGLFGFLKGYPNYTGKPNIPGCGDKGGEYIVVIPNNQFKIISGQDIKHSWDNVYKKYEKYLNDLILN